MLGFHCLSPPQAGINHELPYGPMLRVAGIEYGPYLIGGEHPDYFRLSIPGEGVPGLMRNDHPPALPRYSERR